MERVEIVSIQDPSQTSEARRKALRLADALEFRETAQSNLAIVVTEAATNQLKYAGGGQIILRAGSHVGGVEMLAADKGPGIPNVLECMRDGYSTGGGRGSGLGAISRLSASHEIYSTCPGGTIVRALCTDPNVLVEATGDWDISSIVHPKPGEDICGDAVAARETPDGLQLLVADGLGHGILAADASRAAVKIFCTATGRPIEVLEAMRPALHDTRGAAVSIVEIQPRQGRVLCCGVGNVCTLVFGGERWQHGVTANGIVGQKVASLREYQLPWAPQSMIVMYSDGLSSRWKMDDYPNLAQRRSSVIAAALFRDHRRLSDDASVLVAKPVPR